MTTTAPVDSYRIDIPNSWRQIPVDPQGLRDALLPETAQWERLEAADRRRVELFLQRIGNDLAATNTSLAAVFAQLVENESAIPAGADSADFGLLLASCTLSTLTRAEMGSPLELRPEVILRAMTATGNESASPVTNLDPPSIIDLPAGRAVRLARLIPAPLPVTTDDLFVETYLMPVPPDWETVAMLQFATPCLKEAALFSELFARIATTFVVYREGEPTVL